MKVKQTDPSGIEDKTHIINMIKIYKSQEIFRKKINKGLSGQREENVEFPHFFSPTRAG
jgi:hypothetical protein